MLIILRSGFDEYIVLEIRTSFLYLNVKLYQRKEIGEALAHLKRGDHT